MHVDVNLTSCEAPDAAVTAALAVDFGVTATVAQSMQVMAFFLFDTTTGGTTSNGTTNTNATVAGLQRGGQFDSERCL